MLSTTARRCSSNSNFSSILQGSFDPQPDICSRRLNFKSPPWATATESHWICICEIISWLNWIHFDPSVLHNALPWSTMSEWPIGVDKRFSSQKSGEENIILSSYWFDLMWFDGYIYPIICISSFTSSPWRTRGEAPSPGAISAAATGVESGVHRRSADHQLATSFSHLRVQSCAIKKAWVNEG